MLYISSEDNGTSNIDECILLMAPRVAALSAHSLKVSPQTEGIQRNVIPVLFISKQCTKRVMSVVMSDQNVSSGAVAVLGCPS